MNDVDFKPQPGDTSINIPITFDYKGGRSQNTKGKIIMSIIIVTLTILAIVGVATNKGLALYMRVFVPFAIFYVGLFLMRFLIFNELWYSDVYEGLIADDYEMKMTDIWQIFDIDYTYPYVSYFRNGYKGIFVRMEKDAITGKPEEAMYDHYEAIGDAYNVAHSLNMNIVHIDYMDNVGNDVRLQKMYDDLAFVENPDMHEMLIDIYSNLQDEMRRNYASFDIYLFLTRDNLGSFVYNVQAVCQRMLGGNFITYKVLDRYEIAKVCVALFNLHEFSIVDACENVLQHETSSGIIPISVTHGDGTVDEINKTMAEKKAIAEEQARLAAEAAAELERKKAEEKIARRAVGRVKGQDSSVKKNAGVVKNNCNFVQRKSNRPTATTESPVQHVSQPSEPTTSGDDDLNLF